MNCDISNCDIFGCNISDWKYALISCFLCKVKFLGKDAKSVSFYKRIRTEDGYKNLLHNEFGPARIVYKIYGDYHEPQYLEYYLDGKFRTSENYEPYQMILNEAGNIKVATFCHKTYPDNLRQIHYYLSGEIKREIYKYEDHETVTKYTKYGEVQYSLTDKSLCSYYRWYNLS